MHYKTQALATSLSAVLATADDFIRRNRKHSQSDANRTIDHTVIDQNAQRTNGDGDELQVIDNKIENE